MIDEKQKLAIGWPLLQYKNYLENHPENIITDEIVQRHYINDAIFNKIVNTFLSILNDKNPVATPPDPFTAQENLDYLFKSTLSCAYNAKSRVVFIRDDGIGISVDFYLTKNKWKDNLNQQKIHYGDARDFMKWSEEC